MGLFPPANLYNSATTRIGVICQFAKNNHSISAVLVDGYAKAENCATVSMYVVHLRHIPVAFVVLVPENGVGKLS
jgi:hypothetical protein